MKKKGKTSSSYEYFPSKRLEFKSCSLQNLLFCIYYKKFVHHSNFWFLWSSFILKYSFVPIKVNYWINIRQNTLLIDCETNFQQSVLSYLKQEILVTFFSYVPLF